jgi:transposase-like protein
MVKNNKQGKKKKQHVTKKQRKTIVSDMKIIAAEEEKNAAKIMSDSESDEEVAPLDMEHKRVWLKKQVINRRKFPNVFKLRVLHDFMYNKLHITAICHKHNIPPYYVYRWKKQYKQILSEVENDKGDNCTVHQGPNTILTKEQESEIIANVNDLRTNYIPVTGTLFRAMAIQVAAKYEVPNFKCSRGWLEKMLARHKLVISLYTSMVFKIGGNKQNSTDNC